MEKKGSALKHVLLTIFVFGATLHLLTRSRDSLLTLYESTRKGIAQQVSYHSRLLLSLQDGVKEEIPYRPRSICNCNVKASTANVTVFEPPVGGGSYQLLQNSTCSPEATERGAGQNVVSYSWYDGNRKRDYVQDIEDNLRRMREFYPGYLFRVYSNKSLDSRVCSVVCENQEDFFYCPIGFIDRFDLGNVSKQFQMQWRFLVLGDATVDKFLSRDLDSRISAREADAVKDWEREVVAFHAMRDHPYHGTHMLGGLWGGDNRLIPDAKELQKSIVTNRKKGCCGMDQAALTYHIYPKFGPTGSIRVHDSYLCRSYLDSVPFPTRRPNSSYYAGEAWTGPSVNKTVGTLPKCPMACRPKMHQDWDYC